MYLRDRIRKLANARGMSLPNLEAELGFGNGTIVRWNKSMPNTDKLIKVADYFNVSTDYLLCRRNRGMQIDVESIMRVKEFLYALKLLIKAKNKLKEKDWIELDKVVECIKEGQDSKYQ